MVAKARPPIQHEKGAISGLAGVCFGKDADGNPVWMFTITAAPTGGTSGDGAGWASPGSILIRANAGNSKAYINTGTRASPTWTVIGSQS